MKNENINTLEQHYERLSACHRAYDIAREASDEAGKNAAREDYQNLSDTVNAKGKHYAIIFQEYRDSKERKNEHIDFSDTIWDTDVEPLVRTMRENGIERFTLSSTWSGAVNTAWLFQQNGCTLEGLVRINGKCKGYGDEEYEEAHAYLFRVN